MGGTPHREGQTDGSGSATHRSSMKESPKGEKLLPGERIEMKDKKW